MKKLLKLKVLELGIPQYELARELGLSETRLSRIIRGRLDPTADEREKIARCLHTSVKELFDER
jgi:transcriptional regulator with XRE-family HTH domain